MIQNDTEALHLILFGNQRKSKFFFVYSFVETEKTLEATNPSLNRKKTSIISANKMQWCGFILYYPSVLHLRNW